MRGAQREAGLLVDLVADPRQHLARTAAFPVTAAAAALRVEAGLLREALRDLADAGLLTLACHDTGEAGGEVAVVTLTVPTPTANRRARAVTIGDPAPEPPGRPRPPDATPSPSPQDGQAKAWASSESGEEEAMRLVAERLKSAHPAADRATVDALVASAYDELRDAKVRTFVPILAERRVKALLTMAPPDTRPAAES
jgi:hypothetical protein